MNSAHEELSVILSLFAFLISIGSFFLAIGSYRRAGASVRPYISTGANITPGEMSLTLSNYGAGVAVIKKILMTKEGSEPTKSAVPFLSTSSDFHVNGIYFVQDLYYVRPGDKLLLAQATPINGKDDEALVDWAASLDGLRIDVEYLDIFGKKFRYERVFAIGSVGRNAA